MAIITISRQVAALGDEIATALSKKMKYSFIDRKQIEKRIVELGFPKEKLPKYDERKPGFFASLVKDRDEYLNYLQYAILEAASQGNCILIGRGAYLILDEVPNLVSLRFIANDEVRIKRLQEEFSWTEKQALNRINESDTNRKGFHESFFNLKNEDPQCFHVTLNTGILSVDESVNIIENLVKVTMSSSKENAGKKKIESLLKCQRLVNQLLYDYKININFLSAREDTENNVIKLYGVTDSTAQKEKALQIAAKIYPSVCIKSEINIVQDYKSYS